MYFFCPAEMALRISVYTNFWTAVFSSLLAEYFTLMVMVDLRYGALLEWMRMRAKVTLLACAVITDSASARCYSSTVSEVAYICTSRMVMFLWCLLVTVRGRSKTILSSVMMPMLW